MASHGFSHDLGELALVQGLTLGTEESETRMSHIWRVEVNPLTTEKFTCVNKDHKNNI